MKVRIVIIIILFILALVLLSAAFLYYFLGQNLPVLNRVVTLPFVEHQANYVISQALTKAQTVSTASYDLNIKSEWNAYGSPFSLDTDVLFDGRFEDKPRGKMKVSNVAKIQNLSFLSTIDASLAEDKMYFKISEVPALPFLDMKGVENKWYELEWDKINFSNIAKAYESFDKSLVLIDRNPDEVIDGQLSYHYNFEIVPNENFIQSLTAGDDFLMDIFKQENLNKTKLEIWVSKSDFLLKKASTNFENELLSLSMELNVTDYNQPVSLEKPEKGESMNSLTIDLFSDTNILDVTVFGYLVGIQDDYLTDDKDKDGLYRVWEDLLGSNDDLPDTDNDGYNDIDELKNGYNPNGQGKLLE